MDTKKSEKQKTGKINFRRFLMSALSMVLMVSVSSSMTLPAFSVTSSEQDEPTEVVESVDVDTPDEPDQTDEKEEESAPAEKEEEKNKKTPSLSKATPASGKCGNNANWSLDADGVLTISGMGDMAGYSWNAAPWMSQRNNITKIVIDEGITNAGQAAFHNTSVQEVVIAASVKQINYGSFLQCKSLKTITIIDTEETPSQLWFLGQECFSNCTALEELTLHGKITRVDNSVFHSCTSLKHVTLPEGMTTLGFYMFNSCKALEEVTIPGSVTTINYGVFENCTSLKHVTLSEGLTAVGGFMFKNCSALETVEFPDSLKTIGEEAFYSCTALTEIDLPETLTTINYSAFYNCDKLTEVSIPDSVTAMGNQVFDGCDNLEKGNIPAGMTTVPGYTYRNTKIESIELHDGITSIGTEAFLNAKLTKVTIPDSVTTIGANAFNNNLITEVHIPDSVTNMGDSVFANNKPLEKINVPSTWTSIPNGFVGGCPLISVADIPEGITSIGDSAYAGTAISELNIPSTVTRIGSNAFYNCDNLTEVQLPNGITEMGSGVFDNCNNVKKGNIPTGLTYVPAYIYRNTLISEITLHSGITEIGDGAFRYTKISEIDIPDTVVRIGQVAFADCYELWEVDIPESVKTIDYAAFYRCTRFREVYIPEGVETIGAEAFRFCSNLQDVVIPGTVKTIGAHAFRECDVLRNVTIGEMVNVPEGEEVKRTIGSCCFAFDRALKKIHLPDSITSLGDNAFRECTGLKEVNIPTGISVINSETFRDCDALEYIEIPSNVRTIGNTAFYHCNVLNEVKLNEGLENINIYAFCYCYNLSKVNFPSTLKVIGQESFRETAIKKVDLKDGVHTINYAAFFSCKSLTEVEMPDSVKTMGTQVFDGCTKLVKSNFSAGMTNVPAYTFRNTSLAEITLPDGITVINECAFNNTKLTSITIPESVTVIQANAFNTSLLQELVIPANAKTLGEAAFANNPHLDSVTFNYDIEVIPKNFFKNCGFREYTLPSSVKILREGAFNECKNLKKFTFPKDTNLTTVETDVFGSKMTYFYNVPANLNIAASSFNNSNRAFGAKLNVYIDDASSSMTVKNRLMEGLIDTVTVDKTVTSVNASLITSFINDATTRLYFEPGAHFSLVGNVLIDDFRIISLYEGEYIADPDGVLYKIEDGKARLAYCPVEKTTLVVPAQINGYEVTGVESNAVSSAANLTSITFQAPANIKDLKSLSFAHAKKLEKINGKTTDLDIVALLGVSSVFDTEVIKFRKLFEDTKITSVAVTHVNEDVVLGEYNEQSDIPYVLIRTEHFKTSNTVLERDHPDFNYTLYTGQPETTTVVISPQGSRGYKYTIFFRFLDNYGRLNLNIGKNTFKTPAGSVYEVYVSKVDDTGYYRVDFPEMIAGDTLEVNILSDVTSPLSEGDTLLIWGEMYAPTEEAYTVPTTLPEHYQRVTWQTKPKEFEITANNYAPNADAGFGWTGKDVTLRNGYFFAPTKIKDIALDTIGSDYVRSIDYKFTVKVPEGVELKPEFAEAIANGKWKRAVLDGNTSNFYVEYKGTWAYVFSVSTSGINSLDVNGNGTLQPDITGATYDAATNSLSFYWNVANSSELDEIPQHYNTTFLNNDVLKLTDSLIDRVNESDNVANLPIPTTWEQTIHYTYSADQTNISSTDVVYQIKPAKLVFKKEVDNHVRQGANLIFTLTATNTGMVPYKKANNIVDELPNMYHIPTNSMYTMFMSDTFGKYLKITIKNAKLEPLNKTAEELTVMGTDGWTHKLTSYTTANDTTAYNKYAGKITRLDGHPDYTANNTIVITRRGNDIIVEVTDEDNTTRTYNCQTSVGLHDLLDEIGYFTHVEDVFRVEWNMADGEWIYGDPWKFYVRANTKSTYMLINGDIDGGLGDRGWFTNTSNVYDNNQTNMATASVNNYIYWGSSVWYDKYVTYGLGNMTTLRTHFRSYNAASRYDVMPVVHHMNGAGLALIPAETTWNRSNKQLKNLEKYEYVNSNNESTWYYKLDKPGEYKNIYIGGALADTVTVKVSNQGYDYFIKWYFTGTWRDETYIDIPVIYTSLYKTKYGPPSGSKTPETSGAALNEDASGDVNDEYKIYRQTWVNDHEYHRLYASSGEGSAKILTGTKYIVTERGETPEDDKLETYSIVHANDKVTYRLSVAALGDVSEKYYITAVGRNLYDLLPESSDVHEWVKDVNVTNLEFVDEDGNEYKTINVDGREITALEHPEDWYITYNGRTQVTSGGANAPKYQWITWGDDFKLRLYDKTVYIYVTLDMPDKSIWEDYADSIKGSTNYTVANKLYVYQDTQNVHPNDEIRTVTHELALQAEAMLTKGVVGTGKHIYHGANYVNDFGYNSRYKTESFFTQEQDSRKYYVNDDYYRRDITYYISIYNSGKVRLYIDDLYDVLPKGFKYKGGINYFLNSNGTVYDGDWWEYRYTRNWETFNKIAVVQSEKGVNATYKRGYITATTEMLEDGRQKINFHIRQHNDLSDLSYDERYNKKCYLNPGQAFVFCYSCYTNKEEETEDYANSEIALKHFNYNNEGVRLSNGTVYGRDMFTSERNDGRSYVLDDGQAKGHGFMDGNINTQWLYSEVAVRRGGIEPGITDFVDGIYHTDKAMAKADSNDFALFTDKITWRNTAYNDGNYTLTDYTLTNIMQGPFRYLDTIDLSYQYSGNYYTTRPDVRLMEITDWDENSDWVQFTYNGNTYKVDLDNEWHHVSYNAPSVNDDGEEVTEPSAQDYEVRITKDPITLDMKIDFRFIDKWWSIPEHGNVKLYCSTKVPQGDEWENKSFYNNAYITPNAQNFDERNVSKGIADRYTSIEEDQKAVKNSTQLPVSYGNSTSSYLKVEMTNDSSRSAKSTEDNNFIIIPNSSKNVTYTMSVTSQDRPLVQLIAINNLPQTGDHETFNQSKVRNSKFQVDFADEVAPFVKITEQNQTNGTILDPSLYTVQYSDKVDFEKSDWEGNNDGWYDEPRATSRSIRYIILDDSAQLMKIKARIDMGFNSVVVGDPTQGQFAWDTFGYHCTAYHTVVPQEAAPTEVGIGIPSIPFIEKKLTDEAGGEWNAEEDVKCRFVIYKSEEVSGLSSLDNDAGIAEALSSNNIPYTYCELEVQKGKSQSESLSLNTMCYTYSDGKFTATDEPFEWTHNAKYTVMELALDDNNYAYGDINDSTGNVHTFTYVNSKQKYITAKNKFKLWRLGIIKTDEEGNTLAGAAFGLYSPFEYDRLTDEQVQALTAQLTPYSDGTVLFDKPIETEVEIDGKTYYLKDIKESPQNGTIVWGRLRMTDYAVTEIHAPEGYRRDTNYYVRQGNEFELLSITIVNDKLLGYKLPDSGGYVLYLYLTGMLFAALPTYMLYRKLRRRKSSV